MEGRFEQREFFVRSHKGNDDLEDDSFDPDKTINNAEEDEIPFSHDDFAEMAERVEKGENSKKVYEAIRNRNKLLRKQGKTRKDWHQK